MDYRLFETQFKITEFQIDKTFINQVVYILKML